MVVMGTGLLFSSGATGEGWRAWLDNPRPVGSGVLRVFFTNIYEASLFAPSGIYQPQGDFALHLNYLINAAKKDIVRISVEKIEKQGKYDSYQIKKWSVYLNTVFRDLKKGDSATALRLADGRIIFFINDVEISSFDDSDFAEAFMNIWLGNKASYPRLRDRLTGHSR